DLNEGCFLNTSRRGGKQPFFLLRKFDKNEGPFEQTRGKLCNRSGWKCRQKWRWNRALPLAAVHLRKNMRQRRKAGNTGLTGKKYCAPSGSTGWAGARKTFSFLCWP